MDWLHWISDQAMEKLLHTLDITVPAELSRRYWGAGDSKPRNKHKFYISDYRALCLVTGAIRYALREEADVYYRGQARDCTKWKLRPSLYRYVKSGEEIEPLNSAIQLLLNRIKGHFDISGARESEREALAQHYGMRTRWLDIADNMQTAMWFAYDATMNTIADDCDGISIDGQHDESVGFIVVLAVPTAGSKTTEKVNVLDLRTKSSDWLRPHVQQAFVMMKEDPGKELGDLSAYHVLTMVVPKVLLKLWSNYENIPHSYMYPPAALDRGKYLWLKGLKDLDELGIDYKQFISR